VFENGSLEECKDTATCSTTISIYLLAWWVIELVQESVRREWRKDLNLNLEKIATLQGMGFRRGAQSFLMLVTGVCGIFLFSMMSANRMNKTTINVAGLIGLAAIFLSTISEIYSSLKAQKKRLLDVESGEVRVSAPEEDKLVEEVRKGGVKVDVEEFQKRGNFYSNSLITSALIAFARRSARGCMWVSAFFSLRLTLYC
jgi:hypothetical protein